MIITKEILVAKLAEYKGAAEQYKALADANFGAAQVIEELLRVAEAPEFSVDKRPRGGNKKLKISRKGEN